MKTDVHNPSIVSSAVKGFHSVEFFRAVKERIAKETYGMTFEQFKKYMADKLKESKVTPLQ